MKPTVTLIVPTRNRAPVLERCLESFRSIHADHAPDEIIVVDDCSVDRTAEVVNQFARTSSAPVKLVKQERAMGANAARNAGLKAAHGEIIVFIDDDVLVRPDWLGELIQGLQRSGCAVVSGAVRLTVDGPIVGKHREEVRSILSEVLEAPRGAHRETVPVVGNMAAFRWVFERAQFDEFVRPPMEEYDWLLRTGVTAAFLPDAWLWHYKTPEQLRLRRLLPLTWRRGGEGGRWMRERMKLPFRERLAIAGGLLATSLRAFGHAVRQFCWGGVIVGLGELSAALALVGLIHHRTRFPESRG